MKNSIDKLFDGFIFPQSGVELSNRIVMAPMTTYSGNADGTVSDAELAYYKRRSTGLGMVVTACAYVIPHGKGFFGQIGAHSDAMIPSLTALANTIKAEGAKAILQIYHGGRMSPAAEVPNGIVLSASNVPAVREGALTPIAMTEEQILETITAFGEATRRAIAAGFDGVEIHGANTYLIQQFFSPHANRRTDRWGGDVVKRMAFPLAVTKAVVDAVAKYAKHPFVVGYRLSPEEVENPGITIDDTLQLVDALALQKLDYLHVSTMDFWGVSIRNAADTKPRTIIINERVGDRIPVIGVGSIKTAENAQSVMAAGIPLVALGRELLMEPDWQRKVKVDLEPLRVTLSIKSQRDLVIPDTMWNAMITYKGWFPIVE